MPLTVPRNWPDSSARVRAAARVHPRVAPGTHNPAAELINQICEPLLAPIRRILPSMGGLDLSPIVAFLLLNLIDMLVIRNLAIMTGMYKGLSLAI